MNPAVSFGGPPMYVIVSGASGIENCCTVTVDPENTVASIIAYPPTVRHRVISGLQNVKKN
jgi:hypothetical protein